MIAYPFALRLDERGEGVRIGRKLERRIRPSFVAAQLKALQQRPERFNARGDAAAVPVAAGAADPAELAAPVMGWLQGEKVPAAVLRAADISVRISRTNARAMLVSLCHFVRKTGSEDA